MGLIICPLLSSHKTGVCPQILASQGLRRNSLKLRRGDNCLEVRSGQTPYQKFNALGVQDAARGLLPTPLYAPTLEHSFHTP